MGRVKPVLAPKCIGVGNHGDDQNEQNNRPEYFHTIQAPRLARFNRRVFVYIFSLHLLTNRIPIARQLHQERQLRNIDCVPPVLSSAGVKT